MGAGEQEAKVGPREQEAIMRRRPWSIGACDMASEGLTIWRGISTRLRVPVTASVLSCTATKLVYAHSTPVDLDSATAWDLRVALDGSSLAAATNCSRSVRRDLAARAVNRGPMEALVSVKRAVIG